jgi:hypothetical protein
MSIIPHSPALFLAFYAQILLQASAEGLYANLLARCGNCLLVRLDEAVDFTPIESACAAFHHQSGPGRPANYTISCLVRAMLVGFLYDLSLRQLEQRLYSDLLVRWFVGLDLYEPAPDHATLERFEQWVIEHQPNTFFDLLNQQIRTHFPQESRSTQIGDTYAMRGNVADESLCRRIRHVCQTLLTEMAAALPGVSKQCLEGFEQAELFGVQPEKIEGTLSSEQRKQRLSRIALAADELHRRVERMMSDYSSRQYPQVRQCLGSLGKVLNDEIHFNLDEAGQPAAAAELPANEKGTFRLIGAADPQATLRVHGEDREADVCLGYNIQVAVSMGNFIHETRAYTGAAPDQSGVANLVADQIERQGTCPPKLIYDKAGGSGKVRAQVAKVSEGQCAISAYLPDYDKRNARYGPYDFVLSEDERSLTCPGGQVSTTAYSSAVGDGVVFRFFDFQCWHGLPPTRKKASREEAQPRRCPLWEQCRDPRQGNCSTRQVFISDYRRQVLDAQAYNQTEEFRQDMKRRPRVERVILELTHYNGARHCRRRGLANADFQAKMCATAYNLKLWMRKLSGGQLMAA